MRIDIIYEDFQKAFDKVNHGLMIMKIESRVNDYEYEKPGIHRKCLAVIFHSCLAGRTDVESNVFECDSSVPQ